MPLWMRCKCPKCGAKREALRREKAVVIPHCFVCDAEMNVLGPSEDQGLAGVGVQGEYHQHPIFMDSCAIDPSEVAEHRRRFPEVEITDRGTPIVHSRSEKLAYLNKIGWGENNSYGIVNKPLARA